MESSIMRNASRFLREQKKKRKWQKVLACLALVVAAGTTIALIMPGQALNNTEKVLDCQIEVHQHTADCYAEDGTTLICGLADYVAHTHNELCYNEEGELICKLPEMPAHQHTADCYAEERVLTCGLEETPEDGEGIPVSGGDQENAAPHVHTDECYTTVSHLICGQLEAVEHVHTDACFKEVTVDGEEESTDETLTDTEVTDVSPGDLAALEDEWYFCGKPAHTHSDECYDLAGNVICGYEEHVHTEECLEEKIQICELEEHMHDASCYDENGNIVCGLAEHEHKAKCFVIYWCGLPAHIHNAACYAGMDVTSGDVEGTLRCGLEEHEHTEECLIAPILERVFEDRESGIRVTATYPASAMIPEEAEFRVVRIDPNESPEYYEDRYADVQEVLGQEYPEMVALLNIGFFNGDGTEVEPEDYVEITMQFLDEEGFAVGDPVVMVHFAKTGIEVLESTNFDEQGATTFVTEEFSTYAPVILKPRNGASGGDANTAFEHRKYIDYLGDNTGDGNPDTDYDDADNGNTLDDKYRLYLDMEGRKKSVNLLFVIDRSSSMNKIMGTKRRDKTIYDLLMGENGNDGIIKAFLERNEGVTNPADLSYVGIAWFGGDYNGTGGYTKDKEGTFIDNTDKDIGGNHTGTAADKIGKSIIKYTRDAGVSLNWTADYSGVNLSCQTPTEYNEKGQLVQAGNYNRGEGEIGSLHDTEGTNYTAGLVAASKMLDDLAKKSTNETVVIFLSDGLPTYFFQAADFEKLKGGTAAGVARYGEALEDKSQVCAEGLRKSDGSTVLPEYGFFKQTRDFFDKFKNSYSNIQFYSVAIGTGGELGLRQGTWLTTEEKGQYPLNGDGRPTAPRSFSVLEYMGQSTGGMLTGNSSAQLSKVLQEIIFPKNVVITDELSQYVTFLTTNNYADLDVKVTATPKTGGSASAITLWEGSQSSKDTEGNIIIGGTTTATLGGKAANSIIEKVTVNIEKQIIQVKFKPDYSLSPDYTYTLSFNVEVTEKAFDHYAKYGYPDTGWDATDYPGNSTSSKQGGFYSNKDEDRNNDGEKESQADVSYKIDDKTYELPYDHPVVQTWKSVLVLKKVDEDGNPLQNVAFQLERECDGTTTYITPNSSDNHYVDNYYYYTDSNGIIKYEGLEHGKYTLKEKVTNDQGFIVGTNDKEITFTVKKGRIIIEKDKEHYTETGSDYKYNWESDASGNALNITYEYTLTVTNDLQEIPVEFKKTDEADNPVANAEFRLFKDVAGTSGDILIANGTSGEDGYILWTRVKDEMSGTVQQLQLRIGDYYLVETKSPSGYVAPDAEARIVTFKVTPKTDGFLQVERVEVQPDSNGYGNRWNLTTKSAGGKNVFEITVQNIAMGIQLQVLKQGFGVDSKNVFAGAEFDLYQTKDGSDSVIAKGVTDKDGHIVWTEGTIREPAAPHETNSTILYLPEGSYYLLETKAPKGFQELEEKIPIEVYLDEKVLKVNDIVDGGEYGLTFNSGEALLVVNVHNTPADVKIQIIKTGDSYSDAPESSIALPGAVFELYRLDADRYVNVGDYISDDRGLLVVDKNANHLLDEEEEGTNSEIMLAFGGQYYLKEIQGPYGYNKFTGDIYFKVIADEKTGYAKVVLTDNIGMSDYEGDIILSPDNDTGVSEPIITFSLTVKNHMGVELPETGGNGFALYILSGIALAMTALIALIYKRRFNN